MSGSTAIFGLHAVAGFIDVAPERVQVLWVDGARHDKRIRDLVSRAESAGLIPRETDRKRLDTLAGGERHQGVVAEVKPRAPGSERDLERILAEADGPVLLLVLDGVQDPHNLGACLRTADGAGVDAVVVPRDRACGLTATVRKVATGAAETVPFIQVTNLARTLRLLQHAGVRLIGTAGEAASDLYEADLGGPLALVLGAEGTGLRRLTREHCDELIRIPMLGAVESLNVSVATGICLYEAHRQRQAGRVG
jgi:23S rRNA (guanosine2251-2'-O)-methyltransferase